MVKCLQNLSGLRSNNDTIIFIEGYMKSKNA